MSAPRRFGDRYELRELVGIGGMSEVHLARDLRLDRDVAVKVLHADLANDPAIGARFRREAQKTAGLNHRGIAAVYDTGVAETPTGTPLYIVMEYVDGPTLRDVVRDRGAMTPRRAVSVISDVCEALEFSHRHGVIHRDVKPANIMLTKEGAVKVVDFGIARALADGDGGITRTGAVMGTAHYLSPEQASGGRVDARSDVYSVGCVLYEMATGHPPFSGDSPVAIVYQHVHQEPGAPSRRNGELTPAFDAVVAKAMAKNPDERYQSAADMRVDLIRLQNGDVPYAAARRAPESTSPLPVTEVGGTAPHGDVPASQGRPLSRKLMAVGAVTVLVVAGIVAFGLARRGSTDEALQGRTVSETTGPTVPARSQPAGARIEVPDVSSLTYPDAIRTLSNAGFRQFRQAYLPSSPESRDRVLATNPPARRLAEGTAPITVVMGSGPAAGNP